MTDESCDCTTRQSLDGERCERHTKMMRDLYQVWMNSTDEELLEDISDLSDGYSEDVEALDWSGIRDSSIQAIEDMHARLSEGPVRL